MKKATLIAMAALGLVISLSSFMTTKELAGKWRWLYALHADTGEQLGIGQLTMGMASGVSTEFREDGTYLEQKTRAADGSVSTVTGAWKLEAEGAVLNLKAKDRWTPSKIVKFQNDTLIVEMRGAMQLVMVKEK